MKATPTIPLDGNRKGSAKERRPGPSFTRNVRSVRVRPAAGAAPEREAVNRLRVQAKGAPLDALLRSRGPALDRDAPCKVGAPWRTVPRRSHAQALRALLFRIFSDPVKAHRPTTPPSADAESACLQPISPQAVRRVGQRKPWQRLEDAHREYSAADARLSGRCGGGLVTQSSSHRPKGSPLPANSMPRFVIQSPLTTIRRSASTVGHGGQPPEAADGLASPGWRASVRGRPPRCS